VAFFGLARGVVFNACVLLYHLASRFESLSPTTFPNPYMDSLARVQAAG